MAPPKAVILSPSDARTLRRLSDDSKERRRPPGDFDSGGDDYFGPQVFIAHTGGGIPALVTLPGTGTGTYDDDPRPGSADLDIYRILPTRFSLPKLVEAGFTRTVYNIETTAIPGSRFVVIQRDKFGHWIAGMGSSSSQSPIVHGILSETLRYNGTALMDQWQFSGLYTGTGTSDLDEEFSGAEVRVYDWVLRSGQSMSIGTRVIAGWDSASSRYYVIAGQCP